MKFPFISYKNDRKKEASPENVHPLKNTNFNEHFLFNSLNAIQYYISNNEKKLSVQYLAMLGKLIRFNLNHLEQNRVPLSEELSMILIYLKLQKMRYQDKFNYKISVQDGDCQEEKFMTKNILTSLLEILIEKLLVVQKESAVLHISFNKNNDKMTLSVEIQIHTEVLPPDDFHESLQLWEENVDIINRTIQKKQPDKIRFKKEFSKRNGIVLYLSIPITEK